MGISVGKKELHYRTGNVHNGLLIPEKKEDTETHFPETSWRRVANRASIFFKDHKKELLVGVITTVALGALFYFNRLPSTPSSVIKGPKTLELFFDGKVKINNQAVSGSVEIDPKAVKQLSINQSFLNEFYHDLEEFTELETLDLSYNYIPSVPESFKRLKKLRHLILKDCSLGEIPEWLGELTGLESLDLSFNDFTQLPRSLTKLTQLKSLDLSHNVLSIPEWIGSLSNLQRLILSGTSGGNLPNSLPQDIGLLKNLRYLDASRNGLTTVPDFIGNLKDLHHLDLSSNRLTALPDSFGNLTGLDHLDLSSNQLTRFPKFLWKLKELRFLDLARNQLEKLPKEIDKLTSLQELKLGFNPINYLPNSIGGLLNLRRLDLFHCQVREIPESLARLKKLKELDLSYNLITKIPEAIAELAQHAQLNLKNNPIQPLGSMLSSKQAAFINIHGDEIEKLSNPDGIVGKWKELGKGVTKIVYEHPELEGMVVKVPRENSDLPFLQSHFFNLQMTRRLSSFLNFTQIVIPRCDLFERPGGLYLVEEKFTLTPFDSIPQSETKSKAVKQLDQFLKYFGFRDITLTTQHNAGFLAGTERNPMIAIFDLDESFK